MKKKIVKFKVSQLQKTEMDVQAILPYKSRMELDFYLVDKYKCTALHLEHRIYPPMY